MRRSLAVLEPPALPGPQAAHHRAQAAGDCTASPIVSGLRKSVIASRMWARVARIAVRVHGPVRGLAIAGRLAVKRSSVQQRRLHKFARAGGRYFWNLHAPGWPSRAFDRFVEHELARLKPLRGEPPLLQAAVLALTKRCAYQCEHCCEWEALNAVERLSQPQLHVIVARLIEAGITQLFISGGEPLRRFKELVRVVEQASPIADVWILSSGQGLSSARAANLKQAGLTGVTLSLDHFEPAAHDRFRGVAGAFDTVTSAARSAREAGLLVALSLCATRDFVSARNLEQYAGTAVTLGAAFIQILEAKALGRYSKREVALNAQQQQVLEAFSHRMNAHPSCRRLPAVVYTESYNRRHGCAGAGQRYLYIDTDGIVHPCPFCRGSDRDFFSYDLSATVAAFRASGCPCVLTQTPGEDAGQPESKLTG